MERILWRCWEKGKFRWYRMESFGGENFQNMTYFMIIIISIVIEWLSGESRQTNYYLFIQIFLEISSPEHFP